MTYNRTRRCGYYIQTNTEAGFTVCSWNKKTGSANLGRSNVCRGRSLQAVSIREKKAKVDLCCAHCQ